MEKLLQVKNLKCIQSSYVNTISFTLIKSNITIGGIFIVRRIVTLLTHFFNITWNGHKRTTGIQMRCQSRFFGFNRGALVKEIFGSNLSATILPPRLFIWIFTRLKFYFQLYVPFLKAFKATFLKIWIILCDNKSIKSYPQIDDFSSFVFCRACYVVHD